jgi:hypothetical protein
MGPGGFPSLQNWCDPTESGRVGSIPTLSRHNDLAPAALSATGAKFFGMGKWVGKFVFHAASVARLLLPAFP